MHILYFWAIMTQLMIIIECGECDMSATVSFQDCVYFCVNKYGEADNIQRKYYDRFTGTCHKAVTCTNTLFRVYENRCLNEFESFLIGDQRVSLPEIYESIDVIMVHGNFNAINQKDMCYPGFFSSRKRIKVGVQVYQQYYCDIPVGSDPEAYPSSHGQYFFYQLDIQSQISAVQYDCPRQLTFDIPYSFLLAGELLFMFAVIHHHLRRCRSWAGQSFKPESKQNQ